MSFCCSHSKNVMEMGGGGGGDIVGVTEFPLQRAIIDDCNSVRTD